VKYVDRVAMAVNAEWKTAEEQLEFWETDHNDSEHTKLLLKKQLLLAADIFCLTCNVPKVPIRHIIKIIP
jgi:hypothetical protein